MHYSLVKPLLSFHGELYLLNCRGRGLQVREIITNHESKTLITMNLNGSFILISTEKFSLDGVFRRGRGEGF